MSQFLDSLKWDSNGLVAAIAQVGHDFSLPATLCGCTTAARHCSICTEQTVQVTATHLPGIQFVSEALACGPHSTQTRGSC